jgi:hypothetical protein
MIVTRVGNEPAFRQYRTEDGDKVVSIVAGEKSFRFVVNAQIRELVNPFMEAHWFWAETYRSDLYGSTDEAEREAITALPWLRSLMSR